MNQPEIQKIAYIFPILFVLTAIALGLTGFILRRFFSGGSHRILTGLAPGGLDRYLSLLVCVGVDSIVWGVVLCHISYDPWLRSFNALWTGAVMVLFYDVWFYAYHRLLHHPWLWGLHKRHHELEELEPIAGFTFTWAERLLFSGGAGLFALLLGNVVRLDVRGLELGYFVSVVLGIYGHLNIEIMPARLRSTGLWRYVMTPTFHALHHHHPDRHFGLLTLAMDRIFGTVHWDELEGRMARKTMGGHGTAGLKQAKI